MNERGEKLEDLFAAAIALPAPQRSAFLQGACGGEAELLAELRRLLDAYDSGVFLERSPVARTIEPANPDGGRIGRYKLLQKAGEGGCGTVYLAEQTEPVRRRVALKIIKLGMDTREVIARFEAERQTLALMDHPNIAQVFDCGATDSGRPYFAMEWVPGSPLLRYCDEQTLGIRERLELFGAICRAIQHAHERGVVHRDIKPSNILVARYGGMPVPKVIDFGIAKATEIRPGDHTVFTALTQFIGTPAYMSPEQADLAPVDARSDVYSLGVLLYELVAGVTPFDSRELTAEGLESMRRRIREETPLAPSRRVAALAPDVRKELAQRRNPEGARLSGRLGGDLDRIVLRCLKKEPARRYATAVALAEDVKAFLDHRPLAAGSGGLAPQFQRWSKRHWRTAAVIAGAGIVGAAAAAWYARAVASGRPAMSVAGRLPSVAVLPFTDPRPELGNVFFADGVHEDLIDNLAKIHGLRVMSRQAVLPYRDAPARIRDVAAALDVDDVVEGTVTRSGTRAHVEARLIDARIEQPVWSESYDLEVRDVFKVQAEIADKITAALRATLSPAERRLIARQPTSDQMAYDLYLQARSRDESLFGRSFADHQAVETLYRQAVARDPNFARAYVRLALLELKMYWYPQLDPSAARLALAKHAAGELLRIAPDDPETKLVLGKLAYNGWQDWKEALSKLSAAEADLPNDEDVLLGIGIVLRRLGRWDEALDYLRLAHERDPRWLTCDIAIAETLAVLRRFAAAGQFARTAADAYPQNRELGELALRARFEVDGDRPAFLRDWDRLPPDSDDLSRWKLRYENAREEGDLAASARLLDDAPVAVLRRSHTVIADPIDLERARVAWLGGRPEDARRYALRAIPLLRATAVQPHQEPWRSMRIAEAEALAGDSATALQGAAEAWQAIEGHDADFVLMLRPDLGRIDLLTGHPDKALEVLRQILREPSLYGPRWYEYDGFWSRLAGDPAFQRTLRAAQAL